MDKDGYPTEETLDLIRNWTYTDFNGLMDFVISLWLYPYCVEDIKVFNVFDNEVREINISTGGWSGHEEIIGELKANAMFWLCCWEESKRGGHYRFHI